MASEISVSQAGLHGEPPPAAKAPAISALPKKATGNDPPAVAGATAKGRTKAISKNVKVRSSQAAALHAPSAVNTAKKVSPATLVRISSSPADDRAKSDNNFQPQRPSPAQRAPEPSPNAEQITRPFERNRPPDLTPVKNDPEATIEKMNRIRRTSLHGGDNSPDNIMVTLHAIKEATKAHREILTKKTAAQEELNLLGEKQKNQQEEGEGQTLNKADEKDVPIHYLPGPDRYTTPMANGSAIHTPRFSAAAKNTFNTGPFDPVHPLASPQSMNTIQQRNFAKAFSAGPEETEPIIEIHT